MPFADTLAVLSTEPEHSLGIWVVSLQNTNIVWLQSQDSILDITLCSSVKEGRKNFKNMLVLDACGDWAQRYRQQQAPRRVSIRTQCEQQYLRLKQMQSVFQCKHWQGRWGQIKVLYTSTLHLGADENLHPIGTAEFMENIGLTHDR